MQKELTDLVALQPVRIARDHLDEIHSVMEGYPDEPLRREPIWIACKLFTLGYLAGIRAERKRRITHNTPWKHGSDPQEGRC